MTTSRQAIPPTPEAIEDFPSRLRTRREASGCTRPQLAELLGWSVSRILFYEQGKTEPSLGDLHRLAAVLMVDPIWLAFGARTERAALGSVWVPLHGGGELPIPTLLVEGMIGPLICAQIRSSGMGLSSGDILVVRPTAAPVPGDLWVVALDDGEPRLARITRALKHTVEAQITLVGAPVEIGRPHLLGRVVASLQRGQNVNSP